MMNYEFKVVPHITLPGRQAVECFRDGEFVAGIYPHKDGIHIVSKFITDVEKKASHPRSVLIRLKPKK